MERRLPDPTPQVSSLYGATAVEQPLLLPPSPSSSNESVVDFCPPSAAVTGDGSSDPSTMVRRRGYVTRRIAFFEGTSESSEMGAVVRLPLPLQVAFRVKVLTIFLLQLLLVGVVITLFRFVPTAKQWADATIDRTLVLLFAAASLVLLIGVYLLRHRFPINWLMLSLFTVAESALFVGVGVLVDTDLAVVNCGFTVSCVLIMLLLSGLRRRHDGVAQLLSTFYAGVIAYVATAVVASAVFFFWEQSVVSTNSFAATLGFQLFLMLWFAYDASSMYCIMSPDEYMHCVIYFYTDLLVLAVVVAVMTVVVLALLTLCSSDNESSSSSDHCDCCNGDCDCGNGSFCLVLLDGDGPPLQPTPVGALCDCDDDDGCCRSCKRRSSSCRRRLCCYCCRRQPPHQDDDDDDDDEEIVDGTIQRV